GAGPSTGRARSSPRPASAVRSPPPRRATPPPRAGAPPARARRSTSRSLRRLPSPHPTSQAEPGRLFAVAASPRSRRLRFLLVAAFVSAVLSAPATRASVSPRQPTAYAGLGTWLDIYATASWAEPKRSVAAMARDGVRTLYLQTGNYSQRVDLLHPRALGRFLDAAHAAGLRVVAWYLPSFADPAQDERRALAAIRFRSANGQRFDSFALDIEASLVKPIWLRTQRLLRLSARLRTDAGPHYALGAITPGPVGLRRHPHYWPRFPYRALARVYDAFL